MEIALLIKNASLVIHSGDKANTYFTGTGATDTVNTEAMHCKLLHPRKCCILDGQVWWCRTIDLQEKEPKTQIAMYRSRCAV
mmetsp:Transcript_20403/g.34814  ORF Transcript_20403/g.34814 Transcript_20403/m.34814 type:complete len:82 (+) Transcript_20403:1-246(+)